MKTSSVFLSLCLMIGANSITAAQIDDINRIVEQIRTSHAPDKRQAVYEISTGYSPDSSCVVVRGRTSEQSIKDALDSALAESRTCVRDSVTVLPDTLWGQVRISVACFRCDPGHASEMATQGLMGMPVRLLEKRDGYWRAQTPDGYISWVVDNSLVEKTVEEMAQWRKSSRLIVTSPYQTRVYDSPEATGLRDVVTDLVSGNIMEGTYTKGSKRIEVTLPDGRKGWVNPADVEPIETWAAQNFDADVILDQAYSMEGSPYLWGGTSTKAPDCSGLAKVSYFANGIILMRDASQQALTGTRIEPQDWRTCQPGDLLFFGNADTGRVTHVAIYDHDGNYVHSSGRVKRNSIDPESELYLTTPFLHAVRIDGNEETKGITLARNHPWYFSK